ncbi:MAG TPA: YfhO family protein [Solirubrobacteraceae bacterium]|nr:YfhO family protein [Solirubrobacteraceae bacterium]
MLALAALVAWMFSQTLFGGKVLGPEDLLLYQSPFAPADVPAHWTPSNDFLFDVIYNFHPDMQFARAAVRELSLPSWDPYIGAGEPLLATQQHAIFFPANWITILAPFWSSLAWVAAFKLLAAGAGTMLFLRTLGLRWPAALLGAITYAFNTFLIDWLEHDVSNAFVVLPWLFLTATLLARNRRPKDALLLGGAFGADFLGGHPETSFIVLTPVALWFLALLAHDRCAGRRTPAALAKVLALLLAALVLGCALAAIMYLPLLELLGQSSNLSRSGPYEGKNWLFGFVAPELWGRPDKHNEIAGGPSNYLERTAYFGVLPLVFAIAGLAARRTRAQLFFAVVALLALGLVISVPVYSHLVGGLPVLNRMDLHRYLGVIAFCGAVLAAYGLQLLLTEQSSKRRLCMPIAGAVAVIVPLLWLAAHSEVLSSLGPALNQLPNVHAGTLVRPVLQLATFLRWTMFGVLAVVLLAAAALRPRLALAAGVLAIAVTGYDVVSYNRGFHPAIPASFVSEPTPAALTVIKARVGHQRIGGGVEFLPNLAERYDLLDARDYELPELERRSRLWAALGGSTGGDEAMNPEEDGLLANVFSVRYMLSYQLDASHTSQWRPVEPQPVVENLQALPRAWVAYGWRASPNVEKSLSLITPSAPIGSLAASDTAALDMREPIIEGVARSRTPHPPAAEPARFLRDEDKRVSLSIDARRPGYVVLDDIYYPGWSATIDGHAAVIHPANVAFRAVAVPAGRHVVVFTYAPASTQAGLLISLVALAVLLCGLLLPPALRSRRRIHRAALAR